MKINTTTALDYCEFVTDGTHDSPKAKDEGFKLITSKHLKRYEIDFNSANFISEEDYKKVIDRSGVEQWDILFSMIGTIGNLYIETNSNINYACKNMGIFQMGGDEMKSKWLYYYLQSPKAVEYIAAVSRGTTQGYVPLGALRKMPVDVVENIVRDKIVTFLWNLDEKIKTNIEINNNLEQQAQAIYQQIFIDNVSSNWTEGTLSDIADITMGQSPSGSSYNEDSNGTIFFQGRAEFGFRFPAVRLYTTEPKRMACANDTLMSVRAPVGDLNVAHTDCCIGRGLAAIHSKNNHQSFVLYTMFSLKKQLDVFNGEGTVFGSINRKSLNEMPILIPSSEKLDEFEALVAPMDAAIRNNYDEICRLKQLRDSLLPKLMSGELDVSNIDI